MSNESLKPSALERQMLDRGFVSCRIAAHRMHCHPTTVHRHIANHDLDSKRIRSTRFVCLAQLIDCLDPEIVELFDLRDWSEFDVTL